MRILWNRALRCRKLFAALAIAIPAVAWLPVGGALGTCNVKRMVLLLGLALAAPGMALAQAPDLGESGAEWFEPCTLDEQFATEGAALAAAVGEDLNLSSVFSEWEIELGTGDGVPDDWQFQLLAYALCEGGLGSKAGIPANAVDVFTQNVAAVNTFSAEMQNGVLPFFEGLLDQQEEIAALGALFANNACNGAAGDPASELLTLAGGILAFQEDLEYVIAVTPNLIANPNLFAGYYTLSSEAKTTWDSMIPIGGIQSAVALFAPLLDDLTGLPALAWAFGTGGPLAGCPSAAQIAADAQAILTALGGTAPSLTTPSYAVLQDDAKLANEPLAGAGDYDGDGLTNAQVAVIIQGQGGDANDFVAAATGAIDVTAPEATVTPETLGPTNRTEIDFAVTFTEDVFDFDSVSDLNIGSTGTVTYGQVSVGGSGGTYTVTVSGISGDGTLSVNVSFASDLHDFAGNQLGSTATSDVDIDNTSPAIGLSSTSYAYNEDGTPVGMAATLTRSGDLSASSEVVVDATALTATADVDYSLILLGETMGVGEDTKVLTFPILQDLDVEGTETFEIFITSVTNAIIDAQDTATVAIIDDDFVLGVPTVEFSTSFYAYDEATGTPQSDDLTLIRTGDTSGSSEVLVSLTGLGTATPGADFDDAIFPLSVTFLSGETLFEIPLSIFDDLQLEGPEHIEFEVTSVTNAFVSGTTITVANIVDDEFASGAPVVEFSDFIYSYDEGTGSPQPDHLALTREGDTSGFSEVQISITANGTATPGLDFNDSIFPLIVSFPSAVTVFELPLQILDDTELEYAEFIEFQLTPVSNATIGTSIAAVNIIDDELPPICDNPAGCTPLTGTMVEEGTSLCLRVPDPVAEDSTFTWIKDSVEIDEDFSPFVGVGCRTLAKDAVTPDDAGTYECYYDDGSKALAVYSVTITVTEPGDLPAASGFGLGALAIGFVSAGLIMLRQKRWRL